MKISGYPITAKSRQLKKAIPFLLLQCMLNHFLFAQSYYTGQATAAIGSYRKTAHTTLLPGNDKAMTIRMMDAIMDVIKKVYPSPVGADVGPYGGIWKNYKGTSEFTNAPYTVYLTIPFYELLNLRTGGIEANGEYSSSIGIWINTAKYMLQANPVQYGNDLVFRAPIPGIAVNGFPKYNNMLLLLPPGKAVPWRPATKQEYLENFIEGLKKSLPGRSSTPAERENVVKAGQLLASMSAAEKKQIAYLKKVKYGTLEKGYPEFGSYKWAGFLDAADTTGQQLVIIDENFYDKTLPRTSFQLMVISRQFPPASYSAAAPTKAGKENAARITERINSIVRAKEFLSNLQQLLGKSGWDYVAQNKKERPAEKTVAPKNTEEASKRIVGDWMAMGGFALTEYIFAANGNYQFIGAYSTSSRTSREYYDLLEIKTSSWKGDGSYSIRGNQLIIKGHREKNTEQVPFRFEKVNHGGTGWKDRLYMRKISVADGKEFEVCYEKQQK